MTMTHCFNWMKITISTLVLQKSQINNLPHSVVQSNSIEDPCSVCLENPSVGDTICHLPFERSELCLKSDHPCLHCFRAPLCTLPCNHHSANNSFSDGWYYI
ncbi:hypothetical protein BDA96_03G143500 [Sorghum bicolor]|uniref:Uncharacterized protein n=3 Tax=Sorghum bicolor TaxID=4558 RepID=C5XHY9_SORBI|nr:hypothetical protein SORBI_3003G137000 [Sorghum bicolor]KAG0537372.1 hypothetical protein BDA96_03G143500 [Sorghum bicolor]OQU86739.1 hypothetical protein SORBI_3003G137000 [Sorghum bicolor]